MVFCGWELVNLTEKTMKKIVVNLREREKQKIKILGCRQYKWLKMFSKFYDHYKDLVQWIYKYHAADLIKRSNVSMVT